VLLVPERLSDGTRKMPGTWVSYIELLQGPLVACGGLVTSDSTAAHEPSLTHREVWAGRKLLGPANGDKLIGMST
jgi:hypothetical protein